MGNVKFYAELVPQTNSSPELDILPGRLERKLQKIYFHGIIKLSPNTF